MTNQPVTDALETSDFDHVMKDPAAWYRFPSDVLDDRQLSRSEKQDVLNEWERDLADRSAAAGEGMVPETPALIDRDVRMHDKVVSAQKALVDLIDDEDGASVLQRLWRRITASH